MLGKEFTLYPVANDESLNDFSDLTLFVGFFFFNYSTARGVIHTQILKICPRSYSPSFSRD
jgi:hypothetical protein